MLMCEGSPREKAFELYDALQDNFQTKISCTDKDLETTLCQVFDYATDTVFYWEPIYMQNSEPCKVDKVEMNQARANWTTVIEEFVDEVFDTESSLTRNEFEELVVKKQAWILNP